MSMNLQTSYPAKPVIGIAGQLTGSDQPHVMKPMKNAEASVSIPFGVAVAYKTSSPTSDYDAILTSGAGAKIAGLVAWSPDYARAWTAADGTVYGDLDSVGLKVGVILSVLRAGNMIVVTQQAVKPGDPLFVCHTAATVYSAKGQLGNADESSNTIDCTNRGTWQSTAAALGLAWVEVDFRNK